MSQLHSPHSIKQIADFGISRDLLDVDYYITTGKKIPVKWTAPEVTDTNTFVGHRSLIVSDLCSLSEQIKQGSNSRE